MVRLRVSLVLFALLISTFLVYCLPSLAAFPNVSPKLGLDGVLARSGSFNLSLGVAVSGELSGQNPEDWYYLGPLDFAAYNFSLTTDSSRSDFRIILKAWCPMCPGEESMIEPVSPIDNFGTGFDEFGLFVPPSLHLKVKPEFIVKVEDKNKVGGGYTLLVDKVADPTFLNPSQLAVFYDFGPSSHLLFSFHPPSGGLFNMSIGWSDPSTALVVNGMALSSTLAYESSGGSTWTLFYLEDSDWMDIHIFHLSGDALNSGDLIIQPVELEELPNAGSVNGFLDASDPSNNVKCYLCSIPPGAYYDFNLDVSGSLDASLSVHGNVYVFNTMLWSIGSSGSGGAGEGESVQDLVACQGLSYAMGENGSQFQFTTPENGTVVNTDHVIVAVKAESGSGQFTLTLSRGVMLQLGEGVTGSISFDLLSGRRYAFWRFVGRAHTLYTANVNYTVHNITETARANVYGVFVGYASDFTGGFSRFNVSDVAVETFKKMYSASQGYTNPLFMTPTYGGLTTGFQVCTPFFSEGVKLFGFAFVDIVSWGVVSVDYAEANITLTSLEPNLVKVGEPYVGSIAGKGLVGDLVAVELGGGYCYNFTFRCYGVNPAVEVRSGSGEYLSVFRTLVDYERLPASKSFVVFSGEGGVYYVYVFCIEGEGEYVLTITNLIGSDSLLFYALAFLCLHYLQLQGAGAQTLMLGGISALIVGLIIFVYLLGNIKRKF